MIARSKSITQARFIHEKEYSKEKKENFNRKANAIKKMREEYLEALEAREKAWKEEPIKAFKLTDEEIEKLKEEGRI